MVKIYSTEDCSYCVQLKDWMKEEGIDFEEVVIGRDMSADDFHKEYGFMSVPVTEIDGKFVSGLRKKDILALIKKRPKA